VHSTEYSTPNGGMAVFAITFLTGCASSAALKAATLSWLKPQAMKNLAFGVIGYQQVMGDLLEVQRRLADVRHVHVDWRPA
jgi:hypothetical protein